MPYRSMRRKAPRVILNSVKNTTQVDQSIVASTKQDHQIATVVEVGAPTKVAGVETVTGSKVFSVEVWVNFVSSSGAVHGIFSWYIIKTRSGQLLADVPVADFTAIGLSNVRNQIFHQETSIIGTQDAGPYKFHRRLKIPKHMQRMRAGDILRIISQSSIAGTQSIGDLYKYYN